MYNVHPLNPPVIYNFLPWTHTAIVQYAGPGFQALPNCTNALLAAGWEFDALKPGISAGWAVLTAVD